MESSGVEPLRQGSDDGRTAADVDVDRLALAAKWGSTDKFALLFSALYPSVYSFFRARVPNDADAEELAAEVFKDAFVGLVRYEPGPPGSFRIWLFTIARRRLVDRFRLAGKSLEELVDPSELESEHRSFVDVAEPTFGSFLSAAVARLPESQQVCLLLRFGADLSIEQVAGVMGKSGNAIKQLQFRAIESLRSDASLTREEGSR